MVHSFGFSQVKITPGILQLHIFMVFSFNSTFRFAILNCFNPAETFHCTFLIPYVCLHLHPPNSLISEVSYEQQLKCMVLEMHIHDMMMTKELMRFKIYVVWG